MQLHEIRPKHKSKKTKRIGRGGKKGTYSGRGIKGQRSRAGRKFKPAIRELIKKYPKLRGYKQKLKVKNKRLKIDTINLEVLEKKFKDGETVSPQILLERKIICRIKGRLPEVKILNKGKLTKSLTVQDCLTSKKAKEIIEKNHGVVE